MVVGLAEWEAGAGALAAGGCMDPAPIAVDPDQDLAPVVCNKCCKPCYPDQTAGPKCMNSCYISSQQPVFAVTHHHVAMQP